MNIGTRAIVRVGGGRGFIVDAGEQRLVITAAHCLPHFPVAASITYSSERTYQSLLGPLDQSAPTVCAELLFADPVADVAVLGMPDDQSMSDEADAYESLTAEAPVISMKAAAQKELAWLLSLDRVWFRCTSIHRSGRLWLQHVEKPIEGGMSGSPIVADDGPAIGVVSASGEAPDRPFYLHGPNPQLAMALPGWLLSRFV